MEGGITGWEQRHEETQGVGWGWGVGVWGRLDRAVGVWTVEAWKARELLSRGRNYVSKAVLSSEKYFCTP